MKRQVDDLGVDSSPGLAFWRSVTRSPSVHQYAPLVEQIASRVIPLYSPADHVCKGHLRHVFDKGDRDAAEWQPDRNRGGPVATVVSVKQKYSLSVNPVERDALEMMLRDAPGREVDCSMPGPALPFPDGLIDRALGALR